MDSEKGKYKQQATPVKERRPSEESTPPKEESTKLPLLPKVPQSPFSRYFSVEKERAQKENPLLTHLEVRAVVTEKWNKLSSDDKLAYEQESEIDRNRYLGELQEFSEKNPDFNMEDDESDGDEYDPNGDEEEAEIDEYCLYDDDDDDMFDEDFDHGEILCTSCCQSSE